MRTETGGPHCSLFGDRPWRITRKPGLTPAYTTSPMRAVDRNIVLSSTMRKCIWRSLSRSQVFQRRYKSRSLIFVPTLKPSFCLISGLSKMTSVSPARHCALKFHVLCRTHCPHCYPWLRCSQGPRHFCAVLAVSRKLRLYLEPAWQAPARPVVTPSSSRGLARYCHHFLT